MMRFHKIYALLFLLIFIIEVLIALYVPHGFVRGTLGDILVVMLIYCFVQAFFRVDKVKTIIGTAIFAILVEIAQGMKLIEILGLQDNKLAATVLGAYFDVYDIVAYLLGCTIIYCMEQFVIKK